MLIRKPNTLKNVTVAAAVADSAQVPFGDSAGGRFYVPAASSITVITWYDAPELDGAFLAANDQNGNPLIQAVAAGQSYVIPPDLAPARAVKAVGDVAGTIDICLKS